uniref:Uncharacterized protein n=1 Tax=Arundo donax TaxID=35708 RepID=A0A0A8ZFL5_ARUDO
MEGTYIVTNSHIVIQLILVPILEGGKTT